MNFHQMCGQFICIECSGVAVGPFRRKRNEVVLWSYTWYRLCPISCVPVTHISCPEEYNTWWFLFDTLIVVHDIGSRTFRWITYAHSQQAWDVCVHFFHLKFWWSNCIIMYSVTPMLWTLWLWFYSCSRHHVRSNQPSCLLSEPILLSAVQK